MSKQEIKSFGEGRQQFSPYLLTCVPLPRLFYLPRAEFFSALGKRSWKQSEVGALLRLDSWSPAAGQKPCASGILRGLPGVGLEEAS